MSFDEGLFDCPFLQSIVSQHFDFVITEWGDTHYLHMQKKRNATFGPLTIGVFYCVYKFLNNVLSFNITCHRKKNKVKQTSHFIFNSIKRQHYTNKTLAFSTLMSTIITL